MSSAESLLLIFISDSIVLPFPECHIVVITWDVVFIDWLLPLNSIHLMSFCDLTAHSFLFLNYIHCMYAPQFVYLFTY